MDWAPGDLALCVTKAPISCGRMIHGGQNAPASGAVRTVMRIGRHHTSWCGCISLWFDDGSNGLAKRFRKIEPHIPDAEDAETIYQLVYAPSPVFTEIGDTAPVAARGRP